MTGLIALTLRIPLVAAAMFGGKARTVWELLDREDQADDVVDTAAMSAAWQDTSARRLVQSLTAQRDARRDVDATRSGRRCASPGSCGTDWVW